MTRPVVLMICDGWGVAPPSPGNAIALANTPVFDRWVAELPGTTLEASGEAVGLPAGLMGNSEVGHLNLGAGRMVPQDLLRIDLSLRDGSFYDIPALAAAADHARRERTALHLLGLVSDGGVHSHIRHLAGLLELARRRGVNRVFIHVFTDGRDTPPRSALSFLRSLEPEMERAGARIASVSGRYFAMDRDRHWDRVSRAWAALVRGEGRTAPSAREAVETAYAAGESDEFITPTIVAAPGEETARIRNGDAAVFFNFRADRARQLTSALFERSFDGFPRPEIPSVSLATFTEYKKEFGLPVAFPPFALSGILAESWAAKGIGNVRIAETEKYAHVTYFFNGGIERAFPGEERILVPSWRGATYDLHPEMSAAEITSALVSAIAADRAPAYVVNFANADMVGHTGKLAETISAIETLDGCFGRLEVALDRSGAVLAMTSDHGNAEQMFDPVTGAPHTAHTTNPVPFLLRGVPGATLRSGGSLGDVAPTLLEIQGFAPPFEMSGRTLLARKE